MNRSLTIGFHGPIVTHEIEDETGELKTDQNLEREEKSVAHQLQQAVSNAVKSADIQMSDTGQQTHRPAGTPAQGQSYMQRKENYKIPKYLKTTSCSRTSNSGLFKSSCQSVKDCLTPRISCHKQKATQSREENLPASATAKRTVLQFTRQYFSARPDTAGIERGEHSQSICSPSNHFSDIIFLRGLAFHHIHHAGCKRRGANHSEAKTRAPKTVHKTP